MLREEVYKRILKFVRLCINDPLVTVIIANQNAPIPKKPFVTVEISTITNDYYPITFEPEDDEQTNRFVMNANVQIQSFSDNFFQASGLLETIFPNFYTDIAYQAFEDKIAYRRDNFGVTNLPTQLSTVNEYRAVYEFVISYYYDVTTNIDIIKRIEATDEVNNDTIIIEKNSEIRYNLNEKLETDESFYSLNNSFKTNEDF